MQRFWGAGPGLAIHAFPSYPLRYFPPLQRTIFVHNSHGKTQLISAAFNSPESTVKNEKQKGKRVTRLYSLAVPVFALAAGQEAIQVFSDWQPNQATIKTIYMVFSIVFCWGCCVFGSMNDPFYESEEYRKAGGDGTQHWIYDVEEMEEEEAREELWREDLLRELDEKVGELRDLEEKEKEKELV
ncbi:hypothetical protein O6H91_01G070100 [Diphasiastrum complanatum]|uniref:Uncharacterized protein n=1 Tax=Diphasiastrum complanatum TaxID=34168 RepID=A0ACC2ES50_DIPCM|nr:hypothetical protein O6H91_01G070100 [Diphasiastrum complanatum]